MTIILGIVISISLVIGLKLYLTICSIIYKHQAYLIMESERGFGVTTNPYFKNYPLPKNRLYINQDGDYEYCLSLYNLKFLFEYPILSWCVGYQTTLKDDDNFLSDFEDYSMIKKLDYIYHTYYKMIILEKVFKLRAEGKTSEWKINLMLKFVDLKK